MFADETVLSANNEMNLQLMANQLDELGSQVDFDVYSEKTKTIKVSFPEPNNGTKQLTVSRQDFEKFDLFKCLEVHMCSDGSDLNKFMVRIATAEGKFIENKTDAWLYTYID